MDILGFFETWNEPWCLFYDWTASALQLSGKRTSLRVKQVHLGDYLICLEITVLIWLFHILLRKNSLFSCQLTIRNDNLRFAKPCCVHRCSEFLHPGGVSPRFLVPYSHVIQGDVVDVTSALHELHVVVDTVVGVVRTVTNPAWHAPGQGIGQDVGIASFCFLNSNKENLNSGSIPWSDYIWRKKGQKYALFNENEANPVNSCKHVSCRCWFKVSPM